MKGRMVRGEGYAISGSGSRLAVSAVLVFLGFSPFASVFDAGSRPIRYKEKCPEIDQRKVAAIEMKCLIVVHSYHHYNTKKVAGAMSSMTGAIVKSPEEARTEDLSQYDLIGFGAGIDSGRHYRPVLDFAQSLPPVSGRKCFIFSTSALQGESKVKKDHAALSEILQSKGYRVVGEFSCKGYNTNSFLKYFGGMNKGRPNEEDIQNAREFAKRMLSAL